MEEISEQLKRLGLGEHEALVYGTLLITSPASATLIAKKCSLSRSSVYTTLSVLISKGLVATTYKNDVKQFIAQDQTALEHLLKKEKESLDKKFKLIESLKNTVQFFGRSDIQIPQILFFEGQEGLKKIYLSMMRQAPKNSMRYLLRDEFVWQPEWEFIFKQDWNDTVRRWAIEKNMKTMLLVNSSKLEKSKKKFYKSQKAFRYRFLPARNAIQQFAQYIIGDTVAILSMEKNNFVGIQITNKHLADNFKKTFETLWKGSSSK
jgi:predicted DNA-binding transcriptional regulator